MFYVLWVFSGESCFVYYISLGKLMSLGLCIRSDGKYAFVWAGDP